MPQEGLPDRSRRGEPAWLSDLPSDWQVARLRHVLHSIDQGWSPNAEDRQAGEAEWGVLKLSAISKGAFRPSQHKALPPDEKPYSAIEVRPGDVLVTRANTPQLVADACFVASTRPRLMFSDLVYRLRFRKRVDPRFATYWLLSPPCRHQIEVDAHGSSRSMVKVSQSHIRSWQLPVPPATQQLAIADFLDCKTAQIDRLIEQKERLVELLEEKRTALITRAVTKGLDPGVEMKDSGVEWLGEIPAHWDVTMIKWVARVESGHTPDKKVDAYWTGGEIPWVSLADSGRLRRVEEISETQYYTNERGIRNSSARVLPPGAVVFSRDATVGLAAITTRPMTVSQHFVAWICGEKVEPPYLLHVTYAMEQELERLSMGATIRTIGMPEVRALKMPLPRLAEQRAIVQNLNEQKDRVDGLVNSARRVIDLLREYRTALISAAVTGRLDVREEAA